MTEFPKPFGSMAQNFDNRNHMAHYHIAWVHTYFYENNSLNLSNSLVHQGYFSSDPRCKKITYFVSFEQEPNKNDNFCRNTPEQTRIILILGMTQIVSTVRNGVSKYIGHQSCWLTLFSLTLQTALTLTAINVRHDICVN